MHGWQLSSNHIERKGSFAGFIPARELFFYKKTQKTRVAKRGEIGYTGGKLLV